MSLKHTFLSLAALILVGLMAAAKPTIYGYRVYQPSFGVDTEAGPVCFDADSPAEVTLLSHDGHRTRCYAGTYFNYHWYGQFCTPESQTKVDGWYRIDMQTGQRTFLGDGGEHMLDVTYSYADKTFYGLCSSGGRLLTVDTYTGETTEKCIFTYNNEPMAFAALAADLDGTIYALATDRWLCTIDATSGKVTRVGRIGANINVALTNQSMAFDYKTGVLYWSNTQNCTLYTIDTTTGVATAIGSLGNDGDCITALAIPYIKAQPGAPACVSDRQAFVSGNDVTITWTNPTTDIDGEPLDEIRSIAVYRDNRIATNLMGPNTNFTEKDLQPGLHSFRIRAINSAGVGPFETDDLPVMIGPDMPGAPSGLSLQSGNSSAMVSWSPPEVGAYSGEFSPESITEYLVTRTCGASLALDTLSANTTFIYEPLPYGTYRYDIRAVNATGSGPAARSAETVIKPSDWIVMTDGKAIVHPGKKYFFYDLGGPIENYPDAQYSVLTLEPSISGYIELKINVMDLERDCDRLWIYDGPDTDSPLMAELTGTIADGFGQTYRATNPDGVLTVRFVSDALENRAGWEGTVNYIVMGNTDLEITELDGTPYPMVGVDNVYSAKVINRGIATIEAGSYQVKLLGNDGTVFDQTTGPGLLPMETAVFDLTFTPDTLYQASSIFAEVTLPGDCNGYNDRTAELATLVIDSNAVISLTANNQPQLMVAPASFTSTASIVESIYEKELIGGHDRYIRRIEFYSYATAESDAAMVDVYVGETDRTSLADSPIPASDLHLLYSGPARIAKGDGRWTFDCMTPYLYRGGNLVVLINKYGEGSNPANVTFCGSYDNPDACTRFATNYAMPSVERFDPDSDFGFPSSMRADMLVVLTDDSSDIAPVAIDVLPQIHANGLEITFFDMGDNPACILTPDGHIIVTVKPENSSASVRLPAPGLYIVVCGSMCSKIVAR